MLHASWYIHSIQEVTIICSDETDGNRSLHSMTKWIKSSFVFMCSRFLSVAHCSAVTPGKRVPTVSAVLNVRSSEIFTSLSRIKCYCLSDLHADSEKNQLWVKDNCSRRTEDENVFTVLILPGDVGSEMESLEKVFQTLIENYSAIIYVPGNHEAWRRGVAEGGSSTIPDERAEDRMASDSVEKLNKVISMAQRMGVYVGPLKISGVQNSLHSASKEGAEIGKWETIGELCPDNSMTEAADTKASVANQHGAKGTATAEDFGGVVVFPLYSWYHSSWDVEPEIIHPEYLDVEEAMPFKRKWGDFSMCSWPGIVSQTEFCATDNGSTILAESFAEVNEPFLYQPSPEESGSSDEPAMTVAPPSQTTSPIANEHDTIISFSHFLPRQELCPEKRFLLEPLLTKVIGSRFLESQIRRLRPHLHLFGHTHIPIDLELDGIRYVQWPKGYARYLQHLQMIHDTSSS